METFFANDGAYIAIAFAALAVPAAGAVVAYFWYKLRREEMLTLLKQEMVERGMSADDIRTVIEANPPDTTTVAEDLAAFNGSSPGPAAARR
jgi:hypothetical protein